MILRELLDYFEIDVELPEYLYENPFNEVFLKGNLSKNSNSYDITIKTRKDVTHTMIINPGDSYPVVILSILPNGKTNGTKFGQSEDDLLFI
ncbi:hypothetical protein sm9_1490 [Methanobrevibacter millerae]|uniref:Uncharacterized protein n=1 Tax=Methanobrevibacter millerae TaxID=230361 RepID=A0A0U3DMU4_9EURY|nr:hypothetical protein sm9_1490 [Methanobrevibacter millerae]